MKIQKKLRILMKRTSQVIVNKKKSIKSLFRNHQMVDLKDLMKRLVEEPTRLYTEELIMTLEGKLLGVLFQLEDFQDQNGQESNLKLTC